MNFQPPQDFKSSIKQGNAKFGAFISTGSIQIAELSAFAGVDFLLVDLEHGHEVDVSFAASVIRAAEATRTPVIVRVPSNTTETIAHVLDHGALGICVPHVRNRAEAEEIVANAQYAPDGVRAMSNLVRAFRFSMVDSQFTTTNWEEYWRVANEQVVVMVIIEDREGMENLDDIASVPGVDVIWVGIGDLSQDMGIGGQYDHPSILEAQRAGVEAAKRHGKLVFDTLGQSPEASLDDRVEEVASKLSSGYNLMAWLDVVTYGIAISGLVRTARMGSERRDVQ